MMALEQALADALEGEVRFDKLSRAVYSTDASVYQILPAGVVIPRSEEDVVTALRICREHGVPITARGGGTSQSGQAVGAGIQLDFSKYMRRVLEVDPDRRRVRVEPGIVLAELNHHLEPYGLELPLDLSTASRATIGGMIANNSSGTRSIVYGPTIDYVLELRVLLSDGSIATMHPMEPVEVEGKCRQEDLEGRCYRRVRDLAAEHAQEIARRYPKILRRVGGYNLDKFVPSDGSSADGAAEGKGAGGGPIPGAEGRHGGDHRHPPARPLGGGVDGPEPPGDDPGQDRVRAPSGLHRR